MERRKEKRVSFSDVGPRVSTGSRDSVTKSESFRRGNIRTSNSSNDGKESTFAASIAAAAYAIYSLEETRAEYERQMVESFRKPSTRSQSSGKDRDYSFELPDSRRSQSSRKDRDYSFELPDSRRSLSSRKDRDYSFELPDSRRVSRSHSSLGERRDSATIRRSSSRAIEIKGAEERRPSGRMETEADVWERARIAKINKWYNEMNSKIQEWENEKKKIATLNMERRKAEVERLKSMNLHHYSNKVDWIENVSEGARKQLEEKKRTQEASARQKAHKIRSTGRVPARRCFCFESWR